MYWAGTDGRNKSESLGTFLQLMSEALGSGPSRSAYVTLGHTQNLRKSEMIHDLTLPSQSRPVKPGVHLHVPPRHTPRLLQFLPRHRSTAARNHILFGFERAGPMTIGRVLVLT